MSYPEKEGRYFGRIAEFALQVNDKGNPIVPMRFALTHIWDPMEIDVNDGVEGAWVAVEEGMTTQHTVYLLKKDGSVNEFAVKQLRQILPGWNGTDLAQLSSGEWIESLVQLTLKFKPYAGPNEQHQGKSFLNVDFLFPADEDPRKRRGPAPLQPAAEDQVKALTQKFGAKFRAVADKTAPDPKPVAAATTTAPAQPATADDLPY